MYRADQEFYAAINYEPDDGSAPAQGVLRANADWNDLRLTEWHTGTHWRSLLGLGAGELILRTSMLFCDGLVLHASGVDDNGRGLVFVGHAGAGKSTLASLWGHVPGAIAMNDDRMAIRVGSDAPMCYGTPWGGTGNVARNHQTALAAIVLLEQAHENNIQSLSTSIAGPSLLARAFLPYWDESLMERALANVRSILGSVPVFHLRWRPETAVIPLIRSVL